MENTKGNFFVLMYVIVVLAISILISRIDTLYFYYFMASVFMINGSYSLYRQLKYRIGQADYILFPTVNDEYLRFTNFLIGATMIIGIIIYGYYYQIIDLYMILFLILSLMSILNGIFDIPRAKLKIHNGMYQLHGHDKVVQSEIDTVEIRNNKIITTKKNGAKQIAYNLNINQEFEELIRSYILKKMAGDQVKIIYQNPIANN
jgi:hypothetical protein